MIKKTLLITAILLIATIGLFAQSQTTTSGGEASGSGGSVSYSIGQVAYQPHTGTSGSVSEGVQQSYEISVETAIKETGGINLSVSAYPNPTTDYLTLSIKEFDISNLSYQLYDINGKILKSESITANQTSIAVSNLMSATYFVKVIQGNKEVKTLKIIKK